MSSLNSETLTRYYAGQDAGAGSNYMGMCAAVLADSHESVDCRSCSGRGYRAVSAEELLKFAATLAKQKTAEHRDQVRRALSRASDCEDCRGSGKVSRRRRDHAAAMDSMWTTVRCGTCRGCGETVNPTDTSAERQDVCLACGGAAYIVPVTVRAKGSANQGGGLSATDGDGAPLVLTSSPDPTAEHDDQERNRVARDIEALRSRDPELADALASFHGPEGDAWVEHRWGRGFVVWQHTTAGQQLAAHVAAHSPRRAGYLIAPTERLAQARQGQERPAPGRPSTADALTRVLLSRTDREARELLRRVRAFEAEVESAA